MSRARVLFVLLLVAGRFAQAAPLVLQNDSFQSGDTVACQAGFATGEMGASTLGPVPEAFSIQAVRFLFGGSEDQVTITLHVYIDEGTPNPGPEIYASDFQVTGSNQAIQEIDLSGANLSLPAGSSIRVAVEFHHTGAPGLCRDDDGIQPARNWIYSGTWVDSRIYGLQGDWVLRAVVDTQPPNEPDAGPPDASAPDAGPPAQDGMATPDAVGLRDALQPAIDGSAECRRSEDCRGGELCLGGRCVAVCQSDGDCREGTCFHGTCRRACSTSPDCFGGQVCTQGMCLPGCLAPEDCPGGSTCRQGACWPLCEPEGACWTGETCESGVCRPAPPSSSGSGCSCRSEPTGEPLFLLFGLLALLRRKKPQAS